MISVFSFGRQTLNVTGGGRVQARKQGLAEEEVEMKEGYGLWTMAWGTGLGTGNGQGFRQGQAISPLTQGGFVAYSGLQPQSPW